MTDLTRRDVLRTAAATGVTAAGAGAATIGAVTAQTVDDPWEDYSVTQATKDALTAGNAVAIGVDYLFGTDYVGEARTRLANHAHRSYGDMRDYSGYTGADALHQEIEVGAVEMQQADEKVMTSVLNNIQSADNVAIAKGQVAIAEALNAGKSESQAQNDMEAVIDEFFSQIQQNIINHYETQLSQARHHYDQVKAHSNLVHDGENSILRVQIGADGTIRVIWTASGNGAVLAAESMMEQRAYNTDCTYQEYQFTKLDGTTTTITESIHDTSGHYLSCRPAHGYSSGTKSSGWGLESFDDGSDFIYLEPHRFQDAMDQVVTRRDSVFSDLSGFVSDVYAAYEPGEVDISEIVDPTTYATELSTDNNRGFRQAAASHLGIPTNAQQNVVIDIHWTDREDTKVWTDLYTSYTPTDSDGNKVGWQVGTTYVPSNWSEPLFVVFEDDEGNADMAQLQEDFTLVKAYDKDGNEIDSFNNTQTTTHTSDVQQFQDQLNQLRQEQLRLIEKWEDEDSGGGGGTDNAGLLDTLGFSLFGLEVPGVVTAIGGTGALLYGGAKAGLVGAQNSPAGKAAGKGKNRRK